MTIKSIPKSVVINGWLPRNHTAEGVRSPHLWIITALMVLCTLIYYADQAPLVGIPQLSVSLSVTVHDLHRTLFLIPVIYASLFFRVRGTLVTSFAFLCLVLPRALLISAYPDPLLRPLVFVTAAAFISLFIATQLNRIEREIRTSAELRAAYQELSKVHTKLKESQDQLIRAEKLTLLGQMAASFVHEAKNPVAAAIVLAKLLGKEISKDSFSRRTALAQVSKIESALARGSSLIQNVLDFSKNSPPRPKLWEISGVIDQALELTAHSVKGQSIKVTTELNPSLPKVMVDFDQLQQVYINLILNAIQAMPKGGRLTIRTFAEGNWLKTEVQDTGYGISPENMHKLFTPFFTTKKKGKGVGLGLAVCSEIIRRHQGRIEVQSKEGEGTTFTIYLPLHLDGDEEVEYLKSGEETAKVFTSAPAQQSWL